jgi:hypothetical protein
VDGGLGSAEHDGAQQQCLRAVLGRHPKSTNPEARAESIQSNTIDLVLATASYQGAYELDQADDECRF